MELITGTISFFSSVLTAAFSQICAAEFSSWNPWMVRRIVKIAVSWLPNTRRERYEEEWQSHVNEVPGEIGKILFAVGLLVAACNVRLNAWRESPSLLSLASIDAFCSEVSPAVRALRVDASIREQMDLVAEIVSHMEWNVDRRIMSLIVARLVINSYAVFRLTGVRWPRLEQVIEVRGLDEALAKQVVLLQVGPQDFRAQTLEI
jgi:hypothetical protein